MLETFGTFFASLGSVLSWPTFGFLLIGMALGFLVGILPGLGGSTALALMLPFTFAMDPVTAFAFLLGMSAVTATTGDLTSILFGVPGEASSAATVLDGYPMKKRGEAGRAIGIALGSSLLGALIGSFFLALAVQAVRPLVLQFGPAEFFMVAVLALCFVATLSGKAVRKGLVMASFGVLLSMIGQDPGTGRLRLTFDLPYLMDGISIVPVVVGLFAVPSLLEMMAARTSAVPTVSNDLNGWQQGLKDTLRHKLLIIRCSAIGIFLGMLPGVGGSSSQFIAYAHAKQTSRHPEEFGRGSVEGLAAAGSVNNAKEGGDLVPTLAFGVPGSGQMAILLSAFLITGLTPGPAMLTDHIDVTFSMVWTMVVANIITVILCLLMLRWIVAITRVKVPRLIPFLLLFIALGAYTASNSWYDLVLMLVIGGVAMIATAWGWPLPPLLLGLVLGKMLEGNFFLAYQLSDQTYDWFGRPLVLVMIVLLALAILAPVVKKRLFNRARGTITEHETARRQVRYQRVWRGRALLSGAALLIALWAVWHLQFELDLSLRTKQFPLLAAALMAVFAAWQLAIDLRGRMPVNTMRIDAVLAEAEDLADRPPPTSPSGGAPGGASRAAVEPLAGHAPTATLPVPSGDDDPKATETAPSQESSGPGLRQLVTPAAVVPFLLFFAALYAFGFEYGAPLFTFAYLRIVAKERWWACLLGAVVTWAFLYLMFTKLVPLPLLESQVFDW
ncbi:tripartite tricarboxylate transporter permease [Acrocarpospora catenulata]|uniref:tripartite tricarboxylate transporter permease n=1 Tax=Acrocarpospora catenulata TaxID=2836182 RepID=UPI001BDAF4F5|nr:tripartite tricarboxylate transporter permease [Acrocarpospora catenulata]